MQVVKKSKEFTFALENVKCCFDVFDNATVITFLIDLLFAPPPCADVALDREVEGDLLVGDMGQGLPFRPGTFDGCIRFEA